MKGGPCKEVFEVWQSCVDGVLEHGSATAAEGGADGVAAAEASPALPSSSARKDAATVCAGVTRPLFECMTQHPEYYVDAAGTGPPPPPTPATAAQPGGASPSGAEAEIAPAAAMA
jgi:hypothetical protein